jgi:hypothetical protein
MMPTQTQLVSGLGGAIGCDFRQAQNQLVFVEYSGKLSALNLFRTATTVSSGMAILKGTFCFDFDTGTESVPGNPLAPPFDVFWEQQTSVLRRMDAITPAQIVNLGVADFNSITADTLASLTYSATPIDGNNDPTNKLVTGDVFAVRTNQGNYAKVKVLNYGYNLQLQWVTYKLASPYVVLGTGYQQPEDVKASVDGAHVYVTERTGDLLKVSLASANRSAAAVVSSGMTAPQQLFLDEAHNTAYVVEYAPSGHLWQINLTSDSKTAVLSNLQNAVGLVISADRQYAYISEQTTGPDQGRVSRFQLSGGSRQPVVTGLTAPFFLTWLDATQTGLLVAERDPANRITLINVSAASSMVVASAMPTRPSSVAVVAADELLACCDQAIDEVALSSLVIQPSGPLVMGIGFIPFDKVVTSGPLTGLADTTVDPSYFYQVKDTPFGGTLPIMVNYMRAFNDGAAYYRVKVDGVARTDTFTDEHWNGFEYLAQTVAPMVVGGQPGYYPVRALSDIFLWLNPSLGDLLDSTNLSNGLHTIQLDFVNGAGTLIETSTALTIRVDNNPCTATLGAPNVGGTIFADPICGVLKYGSPGATPVNMPFTASHPSGFATFSFSLIKGANAVALPATPPTSGPVSAAVSPIHDPVTALLANPAPNPPCTTAAFAEYLYVAATANNGWGRQSQYDRSAAFAFALTP